MRPGTCSHRFPHLCQVCPLPCRGSHLEGPHIFTIDQPCKKGIRWVGNVKESSENMNKGKLHLSIWTTCQVCSPARHLQHRSSSKPAHRGTGRNRGRKAGDILEISNSQIYDRHDFSPQEFSCVLSSQGKLLGLQGRCQKGTEETDRVFMCIRHNLYKCM